MFLNLISKQSFSKNGLSHIFQTKHLPSLTPSFPCALALFLPLAVTEVVNRATVWSSSRVLATCPQPMPQACFWLYVSVSMYLCELDA